MKIDQSKQGNAMVVTPHGSLDIDTRKLFQDVLMGLVECGEIVILIDLSAVDFVTSTGLSAMLRVAQALEEAYGKFAVCSLNDNVMRVFNLSYFSEIFDVYPSLDEALATMK